MIPAVILANTIVLGLDSYPEDTNLNKLLEYINLGIYFLFLLEILTKLAGLGFKAFFYDYYNIFDAIIMGVSSIDTVVFILVTWNNL